jgi:hypothetical protein
MIGLMVDETTDIAIDENLVVYSSMSRTTNCRWTSTVCYMWVLLACVTIVVQKATDISSSEFWLFSGSD